MLSMSGRRRSRSPGPFEQTEPSLKLVKTPPSDRKCDDLPNWLTCSTCLAPIVTAAELGKEEIETLKEACYAYKLDLLDAEVTVYSATNSHDNRFDVVRAVLLDTVVVPDQSEPPRCSERDALRAVLSHFQVVATAQDGNEVAQGPSPIDILAELERLEPSTPSGTSCSEKTTDETNLCGRIITSGDPTEEYSWFPGFRWTVSMCCRCRQHLGWAFWRQQAGNEEWDIEFISLIVTRLREKHLSV
jgi:hypothetical protein